MLTTTSVITNNGEFILGNNDTSSIDICILHPDYMQCSEMFYQAIENFGHDLFFKTPLIYIGETKPDKRCRIMISASVEKPVPQEYAPIGSSTYIHQNDVDWAISLSNHAFLKSMVFIKTALTSSYEAYHKYIQKKEGI